MSINSFADKALCVLFPRRCKYCGAVIEPREVLCESCKTDLPRITAPVCHYCGYSKEDCNCKKHKSFYDSIVAPFYYTGAITKTIDRMKFHDNEFICKTMAEDMLETIRKEYSDKTFDLITFIPFSENDKHRRDFNQSETLAQLIAENLGVPCAEVIKQIYEVPTQHSLGSEERKGNVFGIYDIITPEMVSDKNVLLVDDIKTTGSTLNECAKMLKLSGACKVNCITFAVTFKNKLKNN